jgi:hypothetical protein
MGSGAMTYIPSFIKIHSEDKYTRHDGGFISLFNFQTKGSWLMKKKTLTVSNTSG